MRCAMEECLNWTGDGCVCAVLDVEPNVVGGDTDWMKEDE